MSDKPTMYPYRGYEIGIDYRWGDDAGWWYCITSPRLGWVGPFTTHHESSIAARETIDNNMNAKVASDKPTTQDLLLLEVRDLVASVGELRLQLNGVWQRVTALEGRLQESERKHLVFANHNREIRGRLTDLEFPPVKRTMTGTIEGLEGEFTVTPPPEFDLEFNDDEPIIISGRWVDTPPPSGVVYSNGGWQFEKNRPPTEYVEQES